MEPQPPAYNKPDAPGVWMNFDNTVSIYLIVGPDDTFETAARDVFGLVKEAQTRFPGWPRVLYVDIEGHRGDRAGFDADFFEFQQEFIFSTLAPFLTAFALPLVAVFNPEPQRNDLPDGLQIASPPDAPPA